MDNQELVKSAEQFQNTLDELDLMFQLYKQAADLYYDKRNQATSMAKELKKDLRGSVVQFRHGGQLMAAMGSRNHDGEKTVLPKSKCEILLQARTAKVVVDES